MLFGKVDGIVGQILIHKLPFKKTEKPNKPNEKLSRKLCCPDVCPRFVQPEICPWIPWIP